MSNNPSVVDTEPDSKRVDVAPAPEGPRGLSPTMLDLIRCYTGPRGESTWDAGAFDRRRANAA